MPASPPARQPTGGLSIILVVALILSAGSPAAGTAGGPVTDNAWDVAVYGATPGGVIAAYTAAMADARVVLVEPTAHVGGMMASGLSWTDYGDRTTIGGYVRRFFDRTQAAEGSREGRYHFQPHVAERVFLDMIDEADVSLVLDAALVETGGLARSGGRIASIDLANGDTIGARVFIDAGYEGDLMAQAGVRYRLGRESVATFGESLAGARPGSVVMDVPPSIRPDHLTPPPGRGGSTDDRLQDSNYRVCFSSDPTNQVPFSEPPGYDRRDYELVAAYLADRERRQGTPAELGWVMKLSPLTNRKWDVNAAGAVSHSLPGANWAYAEATYAERVEIERLHREYAQGFFHFLATDRTSSPSIRDTLADYGLCADEFTDNANWPHRLYLREGRRMFGEDTLTQHDIGRRRSKVDIIGVASYRVDAHWVSRWIDGRGRLLVEGSISLPYLTYAIPYGSITPRRDDVENLLVPVAASASHVAYTSLRMEPQYMIMGEAAGQAAAIAARMDERVVQRVPIGLLQAQLAAHGAYLRNPTPLAERRRVLPPHGAG